MALGAIRGGEILHSVFQCKSAGFGFSHEHVAKY